MSTTKDVINQVSENKILTVYDFLTQKKDLIEAALPRTITTERLIGVFTMILKSSPQLSKCTQTSLISAVIQTVQLGLQPGNLGHVYLVPFKNKQKDGSYRDEVQLIVGYKGLCELVNRSGRAVVLTAEVVHEKDIFDYELGLTPKLKHIPAPGNRGDIIGVYAIAKNMNANEKVFVYLQKDEIDNVKAASKSKNSDYSPWTTWPAEMAKKTAVKRLCKLLPLSSEIQTQISADETIKNTISADIPQAVNEADWDGDTIEVNEGVKIDSSGNSDVPRGIPVPSQEQEKQENIPSQEIPPSAYKEYPDGSIKE